MELAYIWVAQMIPPSKPIPMIPILMAVSKLLAHSREVKGKVVPMGGQNFKMRIFEFWWQTWNPCKKVSMQSIFLFLIIWTEHRQNWVIYPYLNLPSILTFYLNFYNVPIRILKKELYFTFILFCKDFKSALRIKKFSFWNFDLP